MIESYCPECVSEQEFEPVRCLDGHGADCPELACTACGYALFAGPLLLSGHPPQIEFEHRRVA